MKNRQNGVSTLRTTNTYGNERRIMGRILRALLAADYVVTIDDGEGESAPIESAGEALALVTWDDSANGRRVWNLSEVWIRTERRDAGSDENPRRSFVLLIFSNGNDGNDVVTDYGVSLEPVLDPILDSIE